MLERGSLGQGRRSPFTLRPCLAVRSSRVLPPPLLQDGAEFGRIGRYYAVESMLLWDPEAQKYVADATPSYGKDTLEDFFKKAVKEGLKGQELGDQVRRAGRCAHVGGRGGNKRGA